MTDECKLSVSWQDLARSVSGGVGIQQGEHLVYVSPRFAEIAGMEPEELEDYPWKVVFEPRRIEKIQAALDTALAGGRWQGEARVGGIDGSHVELTLSSLDEDDIVVWSLSETSSAEEIEQADSETLLLAESPRLARTVLSTIDDVVYVIGDDGRFWFWNECLAETTGYTYEEIGEMNPRDFIPEDQYEYVPGLMQSIGGIDDRRVRVDILTAEGERIPHEFDGTTFEDPETGRSFRCGIARDISKRLEREQKIRRQRDELATLNRLNTLLFETTQEVIRTGNEGPIMQILCEHAVESDIYRCAWVGQRERGAVRFTCVASEGFEGDCETIQTDEMTNGGGYEIIREAINTDNPKVSICRDPSTVQWLETEHEDDIESLAAVPLGHGDTVYGCLVLGTKRPNAFSSREQTALAVLGHMLGTVLHAARTQELVSATSVVELEFEATHGEHLPLFFGSDIDGTLSLEGSVPGSEGWILYLSVEGVDPASAADALRATTAVERTRVITDGSTSGRLEVVFSPPSLPDVVSAAGATLQEATLTPDGARFVVEAPTDSDISHIVDHINEKYPEVDLLATRKRDRDPAMIPQPGSILDELTPRQREVLEVAYRAGYFDWPRESTAEEVADALKLARPTVHAHLRKGVLRILSEHLDINKQ
ncbi:bacterio-opsin activator domain-containing protein [Natronomonas gomsonensis]|uniref:bacterio-opsin activator domain-containing protein n=1 Tax=Natronomonas gomsonensis TaxID=1046043 RepID=UPI002DD42D61|nr:bacterio-opsin activator domain-containing protein [Natronomonas gomsonensis]